MQPLIEIRIVSLPDGQIGPENFAAFPASVPDRLPADSVRLRNDWFGVNAGMRSRIGRTPRAGQAPMTRRFAELLGVGDVPQSDAVAQVLESSTTTFRPGDWVVHIAPWRNSDVVPAGRLRKVEVTAATPPQMYLTALGHTAFTAYAGMVTVGRVGAQDTAYVSAAAGGVGGYAAQIAQLHGARVIGSAGGSEKLSYLRNDLKLTGWFDYRQTRVADALATFAPDGLSLYYDNVGGDQLEAAIGVMGDHGRIVLCGMVSAYAQQEDAHGPRNLDLFIKRRLSMTGFTVMEHESVRPAFEASMRRWLSRGEMVARTTEFLGLGALPEAFSSLLRGATIGRTLVRADGASA